MATLIKNESNTASANLVSALIASSGDIVEYAITLQTSDCSAATYSLTIPKADDATQITTNYKVCARITDPAGNTPLYMESASFLVDITDPNAAMALSWSEGATHDSHTFNASWTVSSSTDISSQTLSIHSNSSCSDQ